MHHHIGRFIHQHQHIILIGNIQRYIFGNHFLAFRAACLEYDDGVIRSYPVICFYDSVVYQYISVFYCFLHFIPGEPAAFYAVHQEFIQAQRFLVAFCHNAHTHHGFVAFFCYFCFRVLVIPHIFNIVILCHKPMTL